MKPEQTQTMHHLMGTPAFLLSATPKEEWSNPVLVHLCLLLQKTIVTTQGQNESCVMQDMNA